MSVSTTGRRGHLASTGTWLPILALMVIQLTGCAAPASIEGMTVTGTAVMAAPASFPLKHRLLIGNVSGGEETNPMWTSEVGNEEFRAALEESLRVGQLLARSDQDALYVLRATLLNVHQPMIGFDLKVDSKVRYELNSRSDGKHLWEDTVSADYTATVGEAFLAVERLRLANEGSIRENLQALIQRLHRFPQ